MAKQYPLAKGEGLKAAAVSHAWHLENELTALNDEYSLAGRPVTGRQMLTMIIRRFISNGKSDIGFGLDHLNRLEYNDQDMEGFLMQWRHITNCIAARYLIPDEG